MTKQTLLTRISIVLAIVFTYPVEGQKNNLQRPQAITIDRSGGPPTIPDMPRNRIICFALYTVQGGVLKLSAQFYPLQKGEDKEAVLEVETNGTWHEISRSSIDKLGWLATFRVEGWDHSKDRRYRVVHSGGSTYDGLIRRDPIEKDEIVVAAFTGNSNSDRRMRLDILRNIQAQDPDLLFFSGDQSYDHREHTAAWLLFGRQFGEIIKDRPTIAIPDDHDVGQGNLWGEGGKTSQLPGGADGGYIMPANYVNMVQRAQTSHLPDPFDPTAIQQGIGVYYTSLNVGGVGFAVIEDRKWKTGPAGLIPQQGPRPDHITDPEYDRELLDVPEARLLGDRQLKFLREWGQDWEGVKFKVVLSQTIFAGGAHIHGKHDQRLLADLDSNGWPQSGRARALREIRRFFGFHIGGDQHLATIIRHGINQWEDSIYSFCVPSIVNYYGRWWWPLEDPLDHDPTNPLPFTGRYLDGFENKLTMLAYANPTEANHNAAGYGLVRFKKSTREITMECWPRYIDVTDPATRPFPGWPITIRQEDNYPRSPLAFLPTLEFNREDPVVQIVDEYLGEVVYTLRINGSSWRPKVFREAGYTIKARSQGDEIVLEGINSIPKQDDKTLNLYF